MVPKAMRLLGEDESEPMQELSHIFKSVSRKRSTSRPEQATAQCVPGENVSARLKSKATVA